MSDLLLADTYWNDETSPPFLAAAATTDCLKLADQLSPCPDRASMFEPTIAANSILRRCSEELGPDQHAGSAPGAAPSAPGWRRWRGAPVQPLVGWVNG